MKLISRKLNQLTNHYLMPALTVAIILSLLLVALGSWNVGSISQGFQGIIATEFQLQQTSDEIIYLDEVLTMSARMAAATGDLSWETRYRRSEPQLDAAIKKAIQLAPETYERYAAQTDVANIKLVEMENRAFQLVRQGSSHQALALLLSDAYKEQKQIYAEGMKQTIDALHQRTKLNLDAYSAGLSRSSLFSFVSLGVLVASWLTILVLVNRYIRQRNQAERKLQAARMELEHINQSLEVSEATLRQKTQVLEQSLQELQQAQLQIIQSEKMSSLGQLVAGVAHEINNPVNFIYGNLAHVRTYMQDLLNLVRCYQECYPCPVPAIESETTRIELDFVQEDLPKMLDSMETGTERIRQIVLSLRNFSRMDEAAFKTVDIHEGIDSTMLILEHRLKTQPGGLKIEVFKDYGQLPPVECYPGQLNQVLMNVLVNAMDALEEAHAARMLVGGEVSPCQITIRTAHISSEWVEIAIIDNGCGMSEEVQKRIFDPFFTTKPVGRGTGMGMSISYQIITENHGGKLECFSQVGQGTEFVIQIPIQREICLN
jgi:signal transduction histidine kinase